MRFKSIFVALFVMFPNAAQAQEIVASYIATIGIDDLYNSNGERLNASWQVLRQDRANFHRYGISHPGDEWDPLFGDAGNRAAMERMVRSGSMTPSAARGIMTEGTTVAVTIWGYGGVGDFVEVDVYR